MFALITSALTLIRSTYNKGARFASIVYTAKGTGEVARHTVCLGVSIVRAYKRDLAMLMAKRPTLTGVSVVACDELIASLRDSLTNGIGNNALYTCKGVYVDLATGIKGHAESGEVYVTGFAIAKTVLQAGVYKSVNSSAKTLAKNVLRKGMKSGNFRQFSLPATTAIKADGKTLVFLPAPAPSVSPVLVS